MQYLRAAAITSRSAPCLPNVVGDFPLKFTGCYIALLVCADRPCKLSRPPLAGSRSHEATSRRSRVPVRALGCDRACLSCLHAVPELLQRNPRSSDGHAVMWALGHFRQTGSAGLCLTDPSHCRHCPATAVCGTGAGDRRREDCGPRKARASDAPKALCHVQNEHRGAHAAVDQVPTFAGFR